MVTRKQEAWLTSAPGKSFNPDNAYGLQCKDVADAYAIELFGNWVNTIRPGDGRNVFANANPLYFDKIAQNWNDPNLIPQRGDVINWGASKAVPEGHVAVVLSATPSSVTVVQQDGYAQRPASVATLGYVLGNGARVIGWLRPKLEEENMTATIDDSAVVQLRIINSEVKGWNIDEVHSGALDDREIKAWRGQSWATFIQQAWIEGAAYRSLKSAWRDGTEVQLPAVQKVLNDVQNARMAADQRAAEAQQARINAEAGLNAAVQARTEAEARAQRLENELALTGEDTKQLNALGQTLLWLAGRLGIKK
ncbi:CHAP domain-containing protein [Rathayibacter oskolensis]|uniref:CHAP domain-containing protein n=1 Tax=Rathayibacter oskolensis TaxID=1891671 RepID=UPI00265EE8AB|nr:CHAP domain-containing protein [Rathayibacter oskolensis]WKK71437.1 CHAP domain-containing protein [Rathayibacter oskolensis]